MFLPRACLFDLDGLLLDTEPLHGAAWHQAAAVFGASLSEAQLKKLRGRRRNDCALQINKWLKNPVPIEILLSIQQPIAKRLLQEADPMPGAKSLVQWCSEHKLPMALVTSSSSDSINLKCAPHSWLKLITTRVLGDDSSLKAGKPAPDPFLLAAKRLNVDPRKCWAFEDSQAGTISALAAGCQVLVLEQKVGKTKEMKNTIIDNPTLISDLKMANEFLEKASDATNDF